MFPGHFLIILAHIGYSRGIVLQGYYAAATCFALMLVAGSFIKLLFISLAPFMPAQLRALSTYFFPSSQPFS